jgi:hypothetical protein
VPRELVIRDSLPRNPSGKVLINLPVDAGFIAGSTWDAYGGLREAPSN